MPAKCDCMSPRIIHIPLSGGDRKAQAKGIRHAHGIHESAYRESVLIRSAAEGENPGGRPAGVRGDDPDAICRACGTHRRVLVALRCPTTGGQQAKPLYGFGWPFIRCAWDKAANEATLSTEAAHSRYEQSRHDAKCDCGGDAFQQTGRHDGEACGDYRQTSHHSGNMGKGRGHQPIIVQIRPLPNSN
jgi:hypothetical protein